MKFPLGQVFCTPGVLQAIGQESVHALVLRHSTGDWGVVVSEDRRANEDALIHGDRILSAYVVNDHRIYVITEASREYTTCLLASEY